MRGGYYPKPPREKPPKIPQATRHRIVQTGRARELVYAGHEGRTMSDPLHVLIIDDDEQLLGLLTQIVTRMGHVAVPADSAEAGLELLPFWTFQIALIDHHLPGMEGIVLGEYLRNNNPDMAVALVT